MNLESKNITNRIVLFKTSLNILVDSFDQAGILYKDDEQGDDFDRISEALFKSIVVNYLIELNFLQECDINFKYGMPKFKLKKIIVFNDLQSIGIFRQLISVKNSFDFVLYSKSENENSFDQIEFEKCEFFID